MIYSLNNRGQISLDFLVAVSIFLITFFFIIYSLSGLTASIGYERNLYPSADTLSDQLIKDPGVGENNETCWEQWWKDNNEKVKRIGFANQVGEKPPTNYSKRDRPIHYVLSLHKLGNSSDPELNGLMQRKGTNETNYWWHFGEKINQSSYDEFLEKMNIYPRHDVYIQIRPLNSNYSETQANSKINSSLPNNKEIVKIERIIYVQKYDSENKEWVYLKNGEREVIRYSFLVWGW